MATLGKEVVKVLRVITTTNEAKFAYMANLASLFVESLFKTSKTWQKSSSELRCQILSVIAEMETKKFQCFMQALAPGQSLERALAKCSELEKYTTVLVMACGSHSLPIESMESWINDVAMYGLKKRCA